MKNTHRALLALFFLAIGGLLFIWKNEWIIIRLPARQSKESPPATTTTKYKKTVVLPYWHNDSWHQEENVLIWTDDPEENIYYLVNKWLSLLDEEEIMDRKATLQSAILSPSGQELFLSFDRSPFNMQNPTYISWMWVEGLLKTLRENTISVQSVRFLVHHQPMENELLDFSNSWPIEGFLPKNTVSS